MFSMLAKMLPIEDLNVEEVYDAAPQKTAKVAQQVMAALEAPKKRSPHKPHKPHNPFKHPTKRPLTEFVEDYLNKQPNKTAEWGEMGRYAMSLGFSRSSINNAISRLMDKNIIEKIAVGTYKMSNKSHIKNVG